MPLLPSSWVRTNHWLTGQTESIQSLLLSVYRRHSKPSFLPLTSPQPRYMSPEYPNSRTWTYNGLGCKQNGVIVHGVLLYNAVVTQRTNYQPGFVRCDMHVKPSRHFCHWLMLTCSSLTCLTLVRCTPRWNVHKAALAHFHICFPPRFLTEGRRSMTKSGLACRDANH